MQVRLLQDCPLMVLSLIRYRHRHPRCPRSSRSTFCLSQAHSQSQRALSWDFLSPQLAKPRRLSFSALKSFSQHLFSSKQAERRVISPPDPYSFESKNVDPLPILYQRRKSSLREWRHLVSVAHATSRHVQCFLCSCCLKISNLQTKKSHTTSTLCRETLWSGVATLGCCCRT
jgi:hypothetical protein